MTSPSYPVHEGLQVSISEHSDAMNQDAPEVTFHQPQIIEKYDDKELVHSPAATICGLRKRTFWIVFSVCLIVIAGAIGGGVGGALSKAATDNKYVVIPRVPCICCEENSNIDFY